MGTGSTATARCKAWLWVALLVASVAAALARPVHHAAGGGESVAEIRDAWVGARRGRVPLQNQLTTPSYFKGNGRVNVLGPIKTTADISSQFQPCFQDFEIAFTAGASRVVNISKLRFLSSRSVEYLDVYETGREVDPDTNVSRPIFASQWVYVSCREGYQLHGKYDKPVLSDLYLPAVGAWQCGVRLPRPFSASLVQWTGAQPQCASFDGFRCSKPAVCSSLLADIKKRKVVTPLACGAHHLSVNGVDGYNRPDTWCAVARKILAPSPAKLPVAGSWQCLDGLPGIFKNTPIRWVGFQPQCDSLDGKICNKPATRAACEARVKELQAAVTPLTCGPYHHSVWGVDGYEKSDAWCSVARKLMAPKEAEVFPVRATWNLRSHNKSKSEVTLWLVHAPAASRLQGFFASLAKAPTTIPSKGIQPLLVTSGSVLGYVAPVPPSYYSGQGRIQAITSFRTSTDDIRACLDDVQFAYEADGYANITQSYLSDIYRVSNINYTSEWWYWCQNYMDEQELSFYNGSSTVRCSSMGLGGVLPTKILTYNSSIELLPVVMSTFYHYECYDTYECLAYVLWLVREKGSTQLQAFVAYAPSKDEQPNCDLDPIIPPAVIPRQSLHRMKVISGNIFGFKP